MVCAALSGRQRFHQPPALPSDRIRLLARMGKARERLAPVAITTGSGIARSNQPRSPSAVPHTSASRWHSAAATDRVVRGCSVRTGAHGCPSRRASDGCGRRSGAPPAAHPRSIRPEPGRQPRPAGPRPALPPRLSPPLPCAGLRLPARHGRLRDDHLPSRAALLDAAQPPASQGPPSTALPASSAAAAIVSPAGARFRTSPRSWPRLHRRSPPAPVQPIGTGFRDRRAGTRTDR